MYFLIFAICTNEFEMCPQKFTKLIDLSTNTKFFSCRNNNDLFKVNTLEFAEMFCKIISTISDKCHTLSYIYYLYNLRLQFELK